MKKIFKIFITLLIIPLSLFSYSFDSSIILEDVREQHMKEYQEKESALFSRIENLLLQTSNISITRADVQNSGGLPYIYFNNFEKESCQYSNNLCIGNNGTGINFEINIHTNQIILSNSLGSNANDYNKELYVKNRKNEIFVDKSEINNYKAIKPFNTKLTNLIQIYKEIIADPNNITSVNFPVDTTKKWYKPNGQGGYSIYSYINDYWTKIGSTFEEMKTEKIIHVKTEEELHLKTCIPATTGYVGDGEKASTYICNPNGIWEKLSSVSSGGSGNTFHGDSNIPFLAGELFEKDGGSIGFVKAVSGEFAGIKMFTKIDNVNSGSYWIDDTKMFVIGNNINSISSMNYPLNSIAYISRTPNSVYMLKRMNINGLRWVYQANGYDQVATMFDNIDNAAGGYVFDTVNNKFFLRYGDVWRSTDNTVQLTGKGRTSFSILNSSYTYYVFTNDCTSTTCNGPDTSGFYAGIRKDNMNTFYYATGGKRLNNLIDAIPRNSIAEIYDNNDLASILNNIVYLRDTDTRNRTCYKNTSNIFYTRSNVAIPSVNMVGLHPNLPPAKSCTNVAFSGSNIILDNRTQATDWSDAPVNVGIQIGGVNYIHKLSGSIDFWTNNGSGNGVTSATEIFTRGSRSNFPLVNKSLTVLTKQVGSEARYTTNGVTSSIDNTFKQWFYATSGTRTNNLLDGISTTNAYIDATAISVGYAVQSGVVLQKCSNHWCRIGTSQVVDRNLTNRTAAQVVGITETYSYITSACTTSVTQAKGETKIANQCTLNLAGNGRWYDNCEGGKRNWSNASSYCSGKGMRLPTLNETRSNVSNGIPSCSGSVYTWTSTSYKSNNYSLWNGTNIYYNRYSSNSFLVRCVK